MRTQKSNKSPPQFLDLRILATTDMHGHIGLNDEASGWAQVATLVGSLKSEHPNHLFFDNGDFLQGTTICDLAAIGALGSTKQHPVISVMNRLGYDGVALGNHEFDYGLSFLRDILPSAEFPVVCSNLETERDDWSTDLLLTRSCTGTLGQKHELKVGVFSLIPPQVMEWCRVHLEGKARIYRGGPRFSTTLQPS